MKRKMKRMKKSKNKKINYLLIPAVAGIWGIIIYKVFFSMASDGYEFVNKSGGVTGESVELPEQRKYRLKLNYTDPFTKGAAIAEPEYGDDRGDNYYGYNTDVVVNNSNIQWPEIKYYGLSSNKKKRVGWISISGKSLLVRNGDVCNDVVVKRIMGDSVLLKYKGEYKTFKM